jgi:DNA repair exonuclease SbcCD ATPase subunit
MKLTKTSLSSALAFVSSLSILQAAPAHAGVTPAQEATKTISELQEQASKLADHSDELRQLIGNNQSSWQSQLLQLDTLKDEINRMGRELQALESERDSLSPWQVQAIDRAHPLLKEAATNTEQAIDYFNDNKGHLWTPEYRGYIKSVWTDSDQISHTLKNSVTLAKTHDREQRLSHTADIAATSGPPASDGSVSAHGQ